MMGSDWRTELPSAVKNRFLGFLIWQSIPSTFIFMLIKTFIVSITPSSTIGTVNTSLILFLTFIAFHLSQLLFSVSIVFISSTQPNRPASPIQLALGLVRFLLFSSGNDSASDFSVRAKVSLGFVLFVIVSAVSGLLSALSICWVSSGDFDYGVAVFRGVVFGLTYGLFYVYKHRWVLVFPIIQRPPFFSFKMAVPSAVKQALKLSGAAYLLSAILIVSLPYQFKSPYTVGKFIAQQINFYLGSFTVFLCWELTHHLHQVIHTKRVIFAPPKGSSAAETNPSEPLLAALEESTPSSLLHYLAYLDLCMVCENNVDTWRRAALFEETSETYKRVIALCLRPLEHLASKLSEGLEGCSDDKIYQLSHQLKSPTNLQMDSKYWEPLNTLQLCAWSARIVSSLTARSREEDRFGVAQLSGSNAAVISTLISCLLAVETFMGKKTNLQSSNHAMGAAGIKWATLSTGRKDIAMGIPTRKRGGPLHLKAFAMADVLRTAIYCIVSAFHDEMLTGAKLDKDWVISSKPPFGTRELLLQKLRLFVDFQAC